MNISNKFVEIMQLFPKEIFKASVKRHKSDNYTKKFTSYQHLVTMIYGQISGAKSLRDLKIGYNQHETSHYHLGTGAVKRSTLADANARRNPQIFLETVTHMMNIVTRTIRKELIDVVKIIDSSPINLKGHGFDDWTEVNKTGHTQGLKLHLGVELASKIPFKIELSNANVNDIKVAKEWEIEQGSIYVFDKGYYDYNWWYKISQNNSSFVTRLKSNSAIKVIQENIAEGENILADEEIVFTNLTL